MSISQGKPTPEQVKAARIAAGLTLEQAGERFGITGRGWRFKEQADGKGRKLSPGEYELLLLLAGTHPDYELTPKK
ncbi:helix-turn-helix domain-containing protein [Pantoea sp. CCBC3-3-1]|uniref:helix-turn-helix domain-containing protein n=1 Tax=Pantoea sp. CCBC3-3-1 TaxID=2490851 RepID=UPI0011BDE7A4|nr:helix-turn-helix domain-containing protein [Pantoea sp. CCBC3-3-1]